MTENEAIERCDMLINGLSIDNSTNNAFKEEGKDYPTFAIMKEFAKTCKKALEKVQAFEEIGTVEEFKALKEKNEPKKILYRKQSYGTPWLCPYCEADQIKVEFFSEDGSEPKEKYTFCWQCGTRIDWSE